MPSARKSSPARQENALLAERTTAVTPPLELARPNIPRRRASSSGSLNKGYDSRGSEMLLRRDCSDECARQWHASNC
eukprot:15991-Heterococcus_DN1.PRE.1